jgi:hypothetical protein
VCTPAAFHQPTVLSITHSAEPNSPRDNEFSKNWSSCNWDWPASWRYACQSTALSLGHHSWWHTGILKTGSRKYTETLLKV